MMYVAAFLTAVPQLGEGEHFTSSQQHAATSAIVMIYISGFGWAIKIVKPSKNVATRCS
jgi:hypothetical protein